MAATLARTATQTCRCGVMRSGFREEVSARYGKGDADVIVITRLVLPIGELDEHVAIGDAVEIGPQPVDPLTDVSLEPVPRADMPRNVISVGIMRPPFQSRSAPESPGKLRRLCRVRCPYPHLL